MQHNLHMKELITKIFTDLNEAIEFENLQRLKEGILAIPKSKLDFILEDNFE